MGLVARAIMVREVIREIAHEPFIYGQNDCCKFMSRVAQKITGIDYSTLFPKYDETSYQAVLSAYGGVEGVITRCLGESIVVDPPGEEPYEGLHKLKTGDSVLFEIPYRPPLGGVWIEGGRAFLKTDKGMITLGTRWITKGWHING
tara:strand:+ start:1034 stop:1471 length:438 start_codon:yes stop_codon:yes gene_type:complete